MVRVPSAPKSWATDPRLRQANGVAVVAERKTTVIGSTPSSRAIKTIVEQLEQQSEEGTKTWETHSLTEAIGDLSPEELGTACGCLAVRLFAPDVN